MARRRVTVRDIAEILEHWQAGRSIRGMAKSLSIATIFDPGVATFFDPPG
ncbi:MAG: hypothetical protein QUS33_08615 [Dehalococcoidia bacterium]|nr:hypothetical protein [Dehalococcoidia bacterium]